MIDFYFFIHKKGLFLVKNSLYLHKILHIYHLKFIKNLLEIDKKITNNLYISLHGDKNWL